MYHRDGLWVGKEYVWMIALFQKKKNDGKNEINLRVLFNEIKVMVET